ncbi:MAG TPA: DUF3515 domain-containing protein [Mycobacteriales bacterium]|nr:DUF3515 domain-containing protein [Mycobacteriales bacterium]
MATAVALPVTIALLAVAVHAGHRAAAGTPAPASPAGRPTASVPAGPVRLAAPPRTATIDRYCADLVAALPITLDGLHSRPAQSTSPWVGAWGDPAVTFRCGVPKPAGFGPTSALQVVNGVQWYYQQRHGAVVFTVVDRPVYVELTVPERYSGAPLSGVTAAVAHSLPSRPLDVP